MKALRLFIFAGFAFCAWPQSVHTAIAADDDWLAEEQAPPISDPLEKVNRAVFRFNDKFYAWVLRPVSHGYEKIVPKPVRWRMSSFFYHVRMPVRAVNCTLQGRGRQAGRELLSFGVNTIAGAGGLLDPAGKALHIKKTSGDFGQTLGVWGVKPGPYLCLPVFGPSTVRDFGGSVVDGYLNPLSYYPRDQIARWSLRGVSMLGEIGPSLAQYDMLKKDALEPYTFVRDAYLQHRRSREKD